MGKLRNAVTSRRLSDYTVADVKYIVIYDDKVSLITFCLKKNDDNDNATEEIDLVIHEPSCDVNALLYFTGVENLRDTVVGKRIRDIQQEHQSTKIIVTCDDETTYTFYVHIASDKCSFDHVPTVYAC